MSTTGGDLSSDQGTMEVESGLLTAMLGVKVRRLVLLVVHPDDDSEESRNDGHDVTLRSPPGLVEARTDEVHRARKLAANGARELAKRVGEYACRRIRRRAGHRAPRRFRTVY
jgi:hypothetical protein